MSKRACQANLMQFFSTKQKKTEKTNSAVHGLAKGNSFEPDTHNESTNSSNVEEDASHAQPALSVSIPKNDVGYYLKRNIRIDEATKFHLLEKHWTPPSNYRFPFSVHTKQGKEEKRFLNRSHLEKYSWLVFSEECQGLFCKYCTLFVVGNTGTGDKNVMPLKLW